MSNVFIYISAFIAGISIAISLVGHVIIGSLLFLFIGLLLLLGSIKVPKEKDDESLLP